MADKTRKLAENAPGPFYVDDACSLCQTSIHLAPDHFKESDGYAVACKQPGSE